MKTLSFVAVGTASVLSGGASLAQSQGMMHEGMWDAGGMGGGGYWLLILLCIAVIGLIAWIVTKNNK